MSNSQNLYEIITTQVEGLKNFNPEVLEIPKYLTENLKYPLFEWQKEALVNFLFYENPKSKLKNQPTHLMFNMATGTGKTLLMASTLLYYYKQGYRHFIFFVNQNNIVDKTENNFIKSTHTKYLFKDKIVIDDKTVHIKKVETFSDNTNDIEIKFTTIQKLYNDIHIQRENQTTLDSLYRTDIVMLADEAHHLNADTKSKQGQLELDLESEITGRTSQSDIERKGWEHTVIELILKKNDQDKNNKNVLLEFTATIPENEKVAKKYKDKIIYKFGLKEFLSAGYTKEINLISSTLPKKERILQALLFSWYRHKIALKHGLANFKPVILFRSKTIDESKQDYEEFLNWTQEIEVADFDFLKEIDARLNEGSDLYEQGESRTRDVLHFIKENDISFSEIASFVKNNFKATNVIITNSESNKTKTEKTTEEQEQLLNSLEDKENSIRAIFTVDRLTEGWDVLNLYDIVRLYQGTNTGGSTKKTPEATTKEKQLIGRGVRYYPFSWNEKLENKRKFDDNLDHELRVLEELFYYTYDEDSRYISHLKEELRKDGYIQDNKEVKRFDLKKKFKKSEFYQEVKVWHNRQIDNPNRKKKTLDTLEKDFFVPYRIEGLEFSEQEMVFDEEEGLNGLSLSEKGLKTLTIQFKDFEKHVIQKALNIKAKDTNSPFRFNTLRNELEISSIEELIKDEFMGRFNIRVVVSKDNDFTDIHNEDKLNIILKFLEDITYQLKDSFKPKIGSEFEFKSFKELFSEPKTKAVQKDPESEQIADELETDDWYVLDNFYGTSEEKELINFIRDTIGNLENKYEEVYLLRNEEVYKIYDFDEGRGFQPDFILFLKGEESLHYQIFIEPKGNEFIGGDGTFKTGKEGWKEKFLEQITNKYGLKNILKEENKRFALLGLPFYNTENNSIFVEEFDKLIQQP